MTIAVTGTSGHLGHLVVESLLAHGAAPADVVALARTATKVADLADRGVDVREADYDLPDTLETALKGVDTLVLVSSSAVGQRVRQHTAVVEAATSAGVGRVVYTSLLRADTTTSVLAPEHKATEELLAASGLTTTILRNGWYTENYLADAQRARETGELVFSAGDGRVAGATRADYAEAAAIVALAGDEARDGASAHDGQVYELSGDVAWSFDELAADLTDVLDRPVVYRRVTPDEHTALLLAAGLDEGTAGFVVALDADTQAGVLSDTTGDLARLLGRPTTPAAEGLRRALVA